jgi:transposase
MSSLPNVANVKRKPYGSDMSDAEWQIIEPKLPVPKGFERPRKLDLREVIYGIAMANLPMKLAIGLKQG